MVTFRASTGCCFVLLLWLFSLPALASAPQRIKDLASVAGVRSNQLVGYGLVVGLDGSGDQTAQTPFTLQTFRNMLREFGVQIPANVNPQLQNVAAVAVHADLPAFAKPGQRIDVTISSVGNAKSLRGGTLLVTPLKGLDGQVYAMAQGNLVVGGLGAEGLDGSSITLNVPSVGRIPGGGSVERPAPDGFSDAERIVLNLNRSDFTTARRVSEAINETFGPAVAEAMDAVSVAVRAPQLRGQRTAFLSVLENLEVEPGEAAAQIVLNSRTGTIVIGNNVQVAPAAVTHGSLSVTIAENPEIVQPNALAGGATAVELSSEIVVEQAQNRMFYFAPGVALQDIVTAVNEVGAAPADLMAILEALKQAGALKAELVAISVVAVPPAASISFTDLSALRKLGTAADNLDAVARQFESLFVNEMLKSMRQATEALAEGSLFSSNELSLRQEMLDNQLAVHLSENGGLGLRSLILSQLGAGPVDATPSRPATTDGSLARRPATVMPAGVVSAVDVNAADKTPDTALDQVAAKAPRLSLQERFTQAVLPHLEARLAGSPLQARAVLAQAALETGWGKHVPQLPDGRSSFNLFGIKASADGEPSPSARAVVSQRTTEYVDQKPRQETALFRSYPDLGAAISDYRSLLQGSARYAGVLRVAKDPAAFADALQEAGYATDPNYAMKLKRVYAQLEQWLGTARPGNGRHY